MYIYSFEKYLFFSKGSSTRGNLWLEGKRKISIAEICFALLFTSGEGERENERCHTANNGCVKTPDTRNHLSSTLSCRTVSQLPNWSLCNVDSQCPISCYFHGRQHWHCVTPATDIRNGRGPLCTWFHPMLFSFIDRMDRSRAWLPGEAIRKVFTMKSKRSFLSFDKITSLQCN